MFAPAYFAPHFAFEVTMGVLLLLKPLPIGGVPQLTSLAGRDVERSGSVAAGSPLPRNEQMM